MGETPFAEQFLKQNFRDFLNNTRLDVKNPESRQQHIKRNRMINYYNKLSASSHGVKAHPSINIDYSDSDI